MKTPALLLGLLFSGLAFAQGGDARLAQLEGELSRVRAEQQSVYQQFQILQALQKSDSADVAPAQLLNVPDGSAPSYDDGQRALREREARVRNYGEELRHLADRYQALEAQAAPLLEEIRAREKQ